MDNGRKVFVLGTYYTIIRKKYDEDGAFERSGIDGYCDGLTKKIVVCDMDTFKGWENEPEDTKRAAERHTLRHEIVHAFYNESGLMDNAVAYDGPWPKFEENVDWIAAQGEKIYAAWKETGCLS